MKDCFGGEMKMNNIEYSCPIHPECKFLLDKSCEFIFGGKRVSDVSPRLCPICGEEPDYYGVRGCNSLENISYVIECCGRSIHTKKSMDDAITLWNA